jgi:hypothetical protein
VGQRQHLMGLWDGGDGSTGGALALGAALRLLLALEGAVPSQGQRWHQNGQQDGSDGSTGGALAVGVALGLLLALEGAGPSRGRRWHQIGLRDGGWQGGGIGGGHRAHARTHSHPTHGTAAVSTAGAARSVAPHTHMHT